MKKPLHLIDNTRCSIWSAVDGPERDKLAEQIERLREARAAAGLSPVVQIVLDEMAAPAEPTDPYDAAIYQMLTDGHEVWTIDLDSAGMASAADVGLPGVGTANGQLFVAYRADLIAPVEPTDPGTQG